MTANLSVVVLQHPAETERGECLGGVSERAALLFFAARRGPLVTWRRDRRDARGPRNAPPRGGSGGGADPAREMTDGMAGKTI
ncbi:MAG: hypothetical protein REI09_04485 [Candidatus Dactylopiibacterium sp.]|nr:hypothetical protein [Candidatus Dactylopiibacterium sp.]